MSMKLAENSFNLKEEAEIKGGTVFFNNILPHGVTIAQTDRSIEVIQKIIPDVKIDSSASLIKISKETIKTKIGLKSAFTKINELFGEEKTGKSLHFLKASFFKTDDKTIYTYSEHRTPMQLVEDFSEYYRIELNNQRNTYFLKNIENYSDGMTATNKFMKLINILYIFRGNNTNDNSDLFIKYLDEKKKNLNSEEQEIFTNGDSLINYDISKIILDNKINPYKIFKLIKEIKLLLDNFISSINFKEVKDGKEADIKKLFAECFEGRMVLPDIKSINLYKDILYNANEKDLQTFLDNLKVDQKISEEEITIKLFNEKSQLKEELYSEPDDSTKHLTSMMTANVDAEREERGRGGGNNTKELRQKLNTMSIKQLKILSDKNHIKYGNKNTIKSLINNYMKHI